MNPRHSLNDDWNALCGNAGPGDSFVFWDRAVTCPECRALIIADDSPVAVSVVVPEDGDPVPDVGPDPVVLPPSIDHDFVPVLGHPDDDECTYRSDGTDDTYCGLPAAVHDAGPVVLPRAAVCNNWERWTEDE